MCRQACQDDAIEVVSPDDHPDHRRPARSRVEPGHDRARRGARGSAFASRRCATCRASSRPRRASSAPCRSKDGATLSPSCAMPVADGMVVDTDSDDVRGARRMALELLLSDHAGECVAPCAARCPAGLDIPGFVREIAAGDDSGDRMRGHHRAARAARRAGAHLPAAVRAGVPPLRTRRGARHRRAAPLRRRPGSRGGRAVSCRRARRPPASRWRSSAPARRGWRPPTTCCRRDTRARCSTPQPLPGGMLRYGIPAYRLPKDALDAEIDAIRAARRRVPHELALGPGLHARRPARRRTTRSSSPSARSARRDCAAKARNWRSSGIEFLAQVAAGNPPALGDDVVVVGGGNTAMDCARSAAPARARAASRSSTAARGGRCPA